MDSSFSGTVCTRCVMDTSASGIFFDINGVCNYCSDFMSRSMKVLGMDSVTKASKLRTLIEKIKREGSGKRYDCIVGVSGGVDSSWVLLKAIEFGLRPLAVHMDNGWNSELAQNNIANLINGLGVDLYTHVINWDEYRRLMQAFFDADVVDVELLYDNAMFAVNYNLAAKHDIKFILGGMNNATEGMRIPEGWNWYKFDKKNIKAIGRIFEGVKINTFPAIGTSGFVWNEVVMGRKWYSILDLMEYNKHEAISVLKSKFQYKPYPYKHYESIFTRFYQGYILPRKFGIDKRKMHLSTLILTGQMDRSEAITDLAKIPYPSELDMKQDVAYFIKKMGWSMEDFNAYISRPPQVHSKYPSEKEMYKRCLVIYKRLFGI